MTKSKTWRMPVLCQLLAKLEVIRIIRWERLKPRFPHPRCTIIDQGAGRAQRKTDPLFLISAVFARNVVPSAILHDQIVGNVADVYELVRIELRIVHPAEDDVRSAAHVDCAGGLAARINPYLIVDSNLQLRYVHKLYPIL